MDEESALGGKEKDRIKPTLSGSELKIYRASFKLKHDPERCVLCGSCIEVCPTRAIARGSGRLSVNVERCIACYGCIIVCSRNCYSIEWHYESRG